MNTPQRKLTDERGSSDLADAEEAGQGPAGLRWVDVLGHVMERWVPDALTTAIVLMVVLVALSLPAGGTLTQTVDAYYQGLWMLLGFTMQMTLILVLSLMLTTTPLFKNMVLRIARTPRTRIQVVTMAALCAGF